jgi:hypothetical protein
MGRTDIVEQGYSGIAEIRKETGEAIDAENGRTGPGAGAGLTICRTGEVKPMPGWRRRFSIHYTKAEIKWVWLFWNDAPRLGK